VYCNNNIFTIRTGYGTVRFMWKPADVLPMTAEQKRTLEAWIRAKTTPQRIVLRSRICLLAGEGKSNNAIGLRGRAHRWVSALASQPPNITWVQSISGSRWNGGDDVTRPVGWMRPVAMSLAHAINVLALAPLNPTMRTPNRIMLTSLASTQGCRSWRRANSQWA
jgi:hypothetical protein